jgi:tetratricopeptide (TPR) repeat protein
MRKANALILFAALLTLASGAVLEAQVLATVRGTIKDKASGAPLSGVRATLISAQSQNLRFEMVSDDKGFVYKTGLQPGLYQVLVQRDGYIPAQTSIRLSIADERDISMAIEPVPQASVGVDLLKQGVERLDAGKFAEAAELFGQVIARDDQSFMARFYRGMSFEKAGETEKAMADYLRVLELKPDFALAAAGLGKLLAKQGDFAKAGEYYTRAVAAGTQDPLILYNAGVCKLNTGDPAGAKGLFVSSLASDPGNADAHYQLGLVLLGENDMKGAREHLARNLELDPTGANAATVGEILKTIP